MTNKSNVGRLAVSGSPSQGEIVCIGICTAHSWRQSACQACGMDVSRLAGGSAGNRRNKYAVTLNAYSTYSSYSFKAKNVATQISGLYLRGCLDHRVPVGCFPLPGQVLRSS
jgi:hypothetical protein